MTESERQTAMRAFRRAIAIAGGRLAMGEMLGVTDRGIGYRVRSNVPLKSPAEVEKVEAATGVSRHDLRPDIYPREDSPAHPPAQSRGGIAGGTFPRATALAGARQ